MQALILLVMLVFVSCIQEIRCLKYMPELKVLLQSNVKLTANIQHMTPTLMTAVLRKN